MSFSKLFPVSLKSTLTPPSFSHTSLILKFKLLWSCSNFSQILSIWNKFLGIYPNPSQIFFYFSPIFSHTSLKLSLTSLESLQTSPSFSQTSLKSSLTPPSFSQTSSHFYINFSNYPNFSQILCYYSQYFSNPSFWNKLLWVYPNLSQILLFLVFLIILPFWNKLLGTSHGFPNLLWNSLLLLPVFLNLFQFYKNFSESIQTFLKFSLTSSSFSHTSLIHTKVKTSKTEITQCIVYLREPRFLSTRLT